MKNDFPKIAEFALELVNRSQISTDDNTIASTLTVKRWLRCIMSGVLVVTEVEQPAIPGAAADAPVVAEAP